MKNLFTLILTILVTSSFYSQSRTDKVLPKFEQTSAEIKKVKGWALNETTGKWIENNNCIFQSEVSKYTIGMIPQNFNWIKINKITHQEKTYFIFLYESNSGKYKYPSIRKDWEPEKLMQFLILSEEEYTLIKGEVAKQSGEEIKISSKLHGFLNDRYSSLGGEYTYNEENLIAKIIKTIEKPNYSDYCLILNSQNVENTDVIRFKLPNNSCGLKKEYLKDEYFEISKTEFLTLFI